MPSSAKACTNALLALYLAFAALATTATAAAAAAAAAQPVASSLTTTEAATSTIVCDRFLKTGFWEVDIDNRPALAPECGPPLSLHADRNLHHLPVQLVGIFASYLALATGIGFSILLIRRRRSRAAIQKSLGLEMVAADDKRFALSPVSPTPSHRTWMRNPLRKKGPGSTVSINSGGGDAVSGLNSPISFDNSVVEKDRQSRADEMDRLYAAVMAHDEARNSKVSQVQQPQQPQQPQLPQLPQLPQQPQQPQPQNRDSVASTLASRPADKRLTRVTKLDIPQTPVSPTGPQSPISPIRAIYPPDMEYPTKIPQSPTSWPPPPTPGRSSHPNDMYPLSPGHTMNPVSPTGPKVFLPNDMYPASPPPKPRKMSLPGEMFPLSPNKAEQSQGMYPISPPPGVADKGFPTPVRGPASPRSFISRPGSTSSSASKGRRALKNIRINTSMQVPDATDYEERTPLSASFTGENAKADPRGREPPTPPTAGTVNTMPSATETYESLDEPKPLPPPNPQRRPSNLTIPGSKPTPSLLPPMPQGPYMASPKPTSAASSSNALPLRAAGYDTSITSPVATRTTFLERQPRHAPRGQLTGRTPTTAIPQTPYSAYMPYTPLTPVTPHLVTRRERKERQKIEKAEGRGKTLLDDSDLVKEVDETWG